MWSFIILNSCTETMLIINSLKKLSSSHYAKATEKEWIFWICLHSQGQLGLQVYQLSEISLYSMVVTLAAHIYSAFGTLAKWAGLRYSWFKRYPNAGNNNYSNAGNVSNGGTLNANHDYAVCQTGSRRAGVLIVLAYGAWWLNCREGRGGETNEARKAVPGSNNAR